MPDCFSFSSPPSALFSYFVLAYYKKIIAAIYFHIFYRRCYFVLLFIIFFLFQTAAFPESDKLAAAPSGLEYPSGSLLPELKYLMHSLPFPVTEYPQKTMLVYYTGVVESSQKYNPQIFRDTDSDIPAICHYPCSKYLQSATSHAVGSSISESICFAV